MTSFVLSPRMQRGTYKVGRNTEGIDYGGIDVDVARRISSVTCFVQNLKMQLSQLQ